jgi:HsdM-like protein
MNETALVQKVWNYAHVLRDQGVPYQAYISQISYLLFLKMDDERAGLAAYGIKNGSAIPRIAAGRSCTCRVRPPGFLCRTRPLP